MVTLADNFNWSETREVQVWDTGPPDYEYTLTIIGIDGPHEHSEWTWKLVRGVRELIAEGEQPKDLGDILAIRNKAARAILDYRAKKASGE